MKPKSKSKSKRKKAQIESPLTDFHFHLTKLVVAKICRSVGFKSTKNSALQTLTGITTLYLKALAKTAASYSNAANRTESNIFDVIHALHDLTSVHAGASALHNTTNLLCSSVLEDVSCFASSSVEIPSIFSRIGIGYQISIPPPPNLTLNYRGINIPKWLPEFPEESTYKMKRMDKDPELWENSRSVNVKNRSCGEIKMKNKCGSDMATDRIRVSFRIGRKQNLI